MHLLIKTHRGRYESHKEREMKGATEYYDLFKGESQQIGRLFLQFHTHARGKCFEMYVVPEGAEVKGRHIGGTDDAIEVYGMVSGQRGWTEAYGWIHSGRWQDDFSDIVLSKKEERESEKFSHNEYLRATESERKARDNRLLSSYT